jgi:DNA-binding beta-propeller fold protein YncE
LGVLTDTGESLPGFFGLGKVACSPAATAGIVLNITSNGSTVISFKLPGLTPVSNLDIGSFPLEIAINNAGDRAYFRNFDGIVSGSIFGAIVSGFTFDQTTGVLGSTPLFQVESAFETTASGLDQLAVHPSDASLYVSEPGHVRILDAQTGATTGTITSESLSHPTGICFGTGTDNTPKGPP